MDLLEKFEELHSKGCTIQDIVENIFLNYNAYTNNDDVYYLKKQIAVRYGVELNCVKLIGSSHTGFKKFEKRTRTKDYDFAIIDPFLFREYLLRVNTSEIKKEDFSLYTNNLARGKLHILYVNNSVKEEIKSELANIKLKVKKENKVEIDKDISICFYISEQAFINSLTTYFTMQLASSMREGTDKIKQLKKVR